MKLLFVAAWMTLAAAAVHAQDAAFSRANTSIRDIGAITAARDLYASARYEDALALLNSVKPSDLGEPRDIRMVEQYRSLCLLALGRNDEAETAIAAVVTADPFYQPGEAEASPRVRTTFADVRQRLLPALATERYTTAKAAYDRKAFAEAESQFRDVLRLLQDPQMNGRLGDMRTLASGFLDLAAAAAAPPPAPKDEPIEPAATKSAPTAPPEPKIYSSDDQSVKAPVVVRQEVPQVPASISSMTRDRAVIEVVIDEQGRVASMALRARAHPVYDSLLMNAAREWKYKPATLNGSPVKFRKMIQVTIAKRQP